MKTLPTSGIRSWFSPWRLLLIAIVVVALALLAKRIWFTPPPPPQVATAPVTKADVEDTVLATGTIGAAKLVSVGAQVTGKVERLHVALGDTVKQGQLIAEIDALTQQNNLRNAQAALKSAEAQLRSRQAALKQAELTAARLRQLVAIDAGSRSDLEAAEATLSTSRADVAVQEAQIAQAKVAEDTSKVNLGYTRVTAPMDGVVVAIVTEQGQTVNANQSAPTLIKLARLDTMTIKAQISEADVPRVKPGMPVYFSLLGDPDKRYETKLRAVEPGPTTLATDTSTTTTSTTATAIYYNGIFDVANPDGKLRINMTAQTSIVLAQVKDALTIPSGALGARDTHAGEGRYKVRVMAGGRIMEKSVRIGLNNRVRAEVLEGLAQDEQVVTTEAKVGAVSANNQRGGPPPMF
ncbi:efflux RND transporter periplasmic adaptor subunit [Undibacterium sp. CY18W]|uniref:Efflux RND transporter periplasmic adaptor subunit n=1 Tax=Undibacterium hunanense TaxID=2762292 RepID=A0ABR6ZT80_9BURK|nr:efflux RND transporter periplasmic adaptor subunit [Undibacterium hunanense]MBC3919085.1 efflux RND transporter periplasmic adaptor subunit [Undibacterium hunanense]